MLRQRKRWSARAFASTIVVTALFSECYGQSRSSGDKPPIRRPLILGEPEETTTIVVVPQDDEPPRIKNPGNPAPAPEKLDSSVLLLGAAPGEENKTVVERAADKAIVDPNKSSDSRKSMASNAVPLIWELANAAQSQLSPYFLQLATERTPEPILELAAEEKGDIPKTLPSEPPSLTAKTIDIKSADVPNTVPLEIDEDDPGLPEVDDSMVEDLSEEAEATAPAESLSTAQPTAGPATGSKRPRAIKIPFDSPTDDGANNGSIPPPIQRNNVAKGDDSRDESKQEAPSLDQRSANGQEDQGVDALKASKPGQFKREIQIDDPKKIGKVVPPIVPVVPLDPIQSNRLSRCDDCLKYYLTHPESTSVRSPWAVMHALLAFGGEYELQHGNTRVNAIGWMCHNGTCRTQRIFTPRGKGFVPNVGGGVQGHEGQFLAILAQSNVPLDYPIQIGTNKFKVEDLVRYEMATCKEKSELTFKLIGLSYYLDSNKQWRANDGKVWSIPKLIQEELAQPIVGAACGGTHRLMGFSFSVRQRVMQGQPVNGQFARADKFVRDYIDYTWRLQNPDGSFSTEWYEGRGNEPNDERKVQTTGHMLEWLMYTLPDSEVNQPRVQKSIDFLLSKIYDKRDNKWPIGPRGHATRAVSLYYARFQEIRGNNPSLLQPQTKSEPRSTATKVPTRK
jgi:hypothetical protein